MPQLLLFAPCEKVIFGVGDQAASLIQILYALQTYGESAPGSTFVPNPLYRFSVFSQWYRSSDEEGKIFEQRVSMACENENPILETITAFQMPARLHRIVNNFNKLPRLKAGEYNLSISIKMQGESQWPQPIATYPMNITEAPKVPTPVQ